METLETHIKDFNQNEYAVVVVVTLFTLNVHIGDIFFLVFTLFTHVIIIGRTLLFRLFAQKVNSMATLNEDCIIAGYF